MAVNSKRRFTASLKRNTTRGVARFLVWEGIKCRIRWGSTESQHLAQLRGLRCSWGGLPNSGLGYEYLYTPC